MGSTTSSPVPVEVYDPVTEKTTYNGSIYTGYSGTDMIIQDYPFVLFEPGAVMGENY